MPRTPTSQLFFRLLTLVALVFAVSCGGTAPIKEGDVTVAPGIRLHYRIFGHRGDTVLVLPGGPGLGSRYLEAGLTPLADSHVVVFIDPRGTGRSSSLTDTLQQSAGLAVGDVEMLRSALGIGEMSLIGHHWGAVVALLYAKAHTARVTRVALVSPSPARTSILFQVSTIPVDSSAAAAYGADVIARADSVDPQRFCRRNWGFIFAPLVVTDPAVVRALGPSVCDAPSATLKGLPAVQRQLIRSLRTRNLQDSLRTVDIPLLVLQGDGHAFVIGGAEKWATWAGNGRFLRFRGPSLFPWMNDRSRFLSSLSRFLAGGWPAGSESAREQESRAPLDSIAALKAPAS